MKGFFMEKHSIFDEFTKQYKVTKTINFGLIPYGDTEENIIKNQYLEAAKKKEEAYKTICPIIDENIKNMIDTVLSDCDLIDWENLENLTCESKKEERDSDKSKEKLKLEYSNARKAIEAAFLKNSKYDLLFNNNKLFSQYLPEYLHEINADEKTVKASEEVRKFKVYFDSFLEKRKCMFSSEEKKNTISYRIINWNFPIFLDNKKLYEKFFAVMPQICEQVSDEIEHDANLKEYANLNLSEWFQTSNYQKFMSQKGITAYNYVQGILNRHINLYVQEHPRELNQKFLFRDLAKMLLGGRERPSWLPEYFMKGPKGEAQLIHSMEMLEKQIEETDFINQFENLFTNMNLKDEKIFIAQEKLSAMSSMIGLGLNGFADILDKVLRDGNLDIRNPKEYMSLSSISMVLEEYAAMEPEISVPSLQLLLSHVKELILENICAGDTFWSTFKFGRSPLIEDAETIKSLKIYLDTFMDIAHFLSLFYVSNEIEKDTEFYGELEILDEFMSSFTLLYNKIRSYVTSKPYDTDKMRLMFEKSDFLAGWGQEYGTKETMIYFKDGQYYIGIIEKKYDRDEVLYLSDGITETNRAIHYQYSFNKPNFQALVKTFIRSKGLRLAPAVEKYNLPVQDILKLYDDKTYTTAYRKVNEQEWRESLTKLIDYFKTGLLVHSSYKDYVFNWLPSEEYDNIADFCKDTEAACYAITESPVNFEHIEEYVNKGKMYLFRVSCKDFNKGSTGTPNLHTLYWKCLFSEENRKNSVIRLCGNATMYVREKSIAKPIVHEEGSILLNKWYMQDGIRKPIPPQTYKKFVDIIHKKGGEEILAASEQQLWNSGLLEMKQATHKIIKDRRYTKRTYQLHVPVMLNWQEKDSSRNLNQRVCEAIRNNPDVNIIGIERGERNLIYITIIDQYGNILPGMQKSLNVVEETSANGIRAINYQDRLAAEAFGEGRSWKDARIIRELKKGYLSQVVHEITSLMVKYNAIIVMEDMNSKFKNRRTKIDKDIYRLFEKKLIDKLNYMCFKSNGKGNLLDPYKPGGIMNGYQLTDKFISFDKMKKQNGFIFYVNSGFTSYIDPVTGFANVFKKTEMDSSDFLERFDAIRWDIQRKSFIFAFDYDNFACVYTSYRKKWEVYADVQRVGKEIQKNQFIKGYIMNPNEELINLFEKKGICYQNGHNLVKEIADFSNKDKRWIAYLFRQIISLRNSIEDTVTDDSIDFILSPVLHEESFFDSRRKDMSLPVDGDANGAFCIALKGLYIVTRIIKDTDLKSANFCRFSVDDWLRYMQTRKVESQSNRKENGNSFYSDGNMTEIKRRIDNIRSGKSTLKEHDLLE